MPDDLVLYFVFTFTVGVTKSEIVYFGILPNAILTNEFKLLLFTNSVFV